MATKQAPEPKDPKKKTTTKVSVEEQVTEEQASGLPGLLDDVLELSQAQTKALIIVQQQYNWLRGILKYSLVIQAATIAWVILFWRG